MRPILALLAVSVFIGMRAHKSGGAISYRILFGVSVVCVMAFYSQRFI